jgi:hypothetical protein
VNCCLKYNLLLYQPNFSSHEKRENCKRTKK